MMFEDIVKAVSRKLRAYMEFQRREEEFELGCFKAYKDEYATLQSLNQLPSINCRVSSSGKIQGGPQRGDSSTSHAEVLSSGSEHRQLGSGVPRGEAQRIVTMATKLLVATESLLLSGEESYYFRLRSANGAMDRFYPSSRHQENWSRNYRRPHKQSSNPYSPLAIPGCFQTSLYASNVPNMGHSSAKKGGLARNRSQRDNYAQTESCCGQGVTLRPEDLFTDSNHPTHPIGKASVLTSPRVNPRAQFNESFRGNRRSTIAGSLTEPTSNVGRRSSEGNVNSSSSNNNNNNQVSIGFLEYKTPEPPSQRPPIPPLPPPPVVQSHFSVDSSWSESSSLSEISGFSSSTTDYRGSDSQDADSSSFTSTSSSCSGAEAPSLTGSEPDSDSESLSSKGSNSGTSTSCCCHEQGGGCASKYCPRGDSSDVTKSRSTGVTNISSTDWNTKSNEPVHRTSGIDNHTHSLEELSACSLSKLGFCSHTATETTSYSIKESGFSETNKSISGRILDGMRTSSVITLPEDNREEGGGNVCDGKSQGDSDEGSSGDDGHRNESSGVSAPAATSSTFPEEYQLQDLTETETTQNDTKDDVESLSKEDVDSEFRSEKTHTLSEDSEKDSEEEEDVERSSSSCHCEKSNEQEASSSKEEDPGGGTSEADCSVCLLEKYGTVGNRALSPDVYVVQGTSREEEERKESSVPRVDETKEDFVKVTPSKTALKAKSPDYLKPDFDFEPEIVHRGKPIADESDEGSGTFRRLSEEEFVATLSIHDAARKGDMHVVKLLVKKNPKQMETVDERGWTPIHLAAAYGHADIVKYLALEGAHLAALDPSSYTAIHIASMNGHNNCVEILLQMGVNVDCVTAEGFTPLHLAAMNAHLECCQTLLHWGASLDKKDALGRGVHDMVEEYNLEDVAQLICNFKRQLESFQSMLKLIKPVSGEGIPETLAAARAQSVPRDVLEMLASIAEESGPE